MLISQFVVFEGIDKKLGKDVFLHLCLILLDVNRIFHVLTVHMVLVMYHERWIFNHCGAARIRTCFKLWRIVQVAFSIDDWSSAYFVVSFKRPGKLKLLVFKFSHFTLYLAYQIDDIGWALSCRFIIGIWYIDRLIFSFLNIFVQNKVSISLLGPKIRTIELINHTKERFGNLKSPCGVFLLEFYIFLFVFFIFYLLLKLIFFLNFDSDGLPAMKTCHSAKFRSLRARRHHWLICIQSTLCLFQVVKVCRFIDFVPFFNISLFILL